ncbi:YybH family protein [Streptomyces sp. NPDC020681]|uniref:YybH family protein n=1 Tax=Streptomyces sp. NPDC020681 TaxID=3365083 RepID=UPI0037AEB474
MSTGIDLNALELTADPDQQNEVFLIAFNSYDGAVFDRLYRDDAISNLSGAPLTGAARKAKITELLAQKPSLKATLRHSYTAGDVQLIVVDYEMEVPGPDGERQELRGTCTDVLRRGEDGKWLMAIDRPIPEEQPAAAA